MGFKVAGSSGGDSEPAVDATLLLQSLQKRASMGFPLRLSILNTGR
jgi:hypothetical protein